MERSFETCIKIFCFLVLTSSTSQTKWYNVVCCMLELQWPNLQILPALQSWLLGTPWHNWRILPFSHHKMHKYIEDSATSLPNYYHSRPFWLKARIWKWAPESSRLHKDRSLPVSGLQAVKLHVWRDFNLIAFELRFFFLNFGMDVVLFMILVMYLSFHHNCLVRYGVSLCY